jgi:hypothetical protein
MWYCSGQIYLSAEKYEDRYTDGPIIVEPLMKNRRIIPNERIYCLI